MSPDTDQADIRSAVAAAFDTASGEGDGGADAAASTTSPPEPSQETPSNSAGEISGYLADGTATDAPQQSTSPDATTPDGRQRDEKGRFAPIAKAAQSATAGPGTATTTQAKAAAGLASGQAQPATQAATPEALKAPPGWTPAAREQWAKLPPTVQSEVWKRERETNQALRQSTESRQFHQSFAQMVQPYQAILAAEGVDPLTATRNLFQAVNTLHTGTPGHKAQIVAAIARTYDVDIGLLDKALVGQLPQDGGGQQNYSPQLIAQHVEQRVMEQIGQQRQRALEERAVHEVDNFGEQREFFDDVRGTMSMLMDAATAQRRHLPLDEAYKMALGFHPDISQVMQQREAAKGARNAQASTDRSKAAASSIRSQPATAPKLPNGAPRWEDAVAAAFDEVSSR